MALHDAECTELLQLDPCHKYVWCLDACLKEFQLNVKQCKELEIVLDGVRRGQDTVMADLALISADPRTMHLFGYLCIRMLQQCVEKEQQPRDNQGLILILRILNLGASAWEMFNTEKFKEPKLDPTIVSVFLPLLADMMAEDQCRVQAENLSGIPEEIGELGNLTAKAPADFCEFIGKNRLCCFVALSYILFAVEFKQDFVPFLRLQPAIAESKDQLAYEATFLDTFVSAMIQNFSKGQLSDEIFFKTIVKDFFLPCISTLAVRHQLMRLVFYTWNRMPAAEISNLKATLAPTDADSVSYKNCYALFCAKIRRIYA